MDLFISTKDSTQKIFSMSNTEIKQLVNIFLKKNKLEKGLLDIEVKKAWFELMDNGVANYTIDVSLKNKTLFIKLSSPALKQELGFTFEVFLINEKRLSSFSSPSITNFPLNILCRQCSELTCENPNISESVNSLLIFLDTSFK